jgi:group I intron endonuclease
MKQGIYQIRNIQNNKIYVGSSVNLKHRWLTHRHLLINGKHHSIILQRAWIKYGEDIFVFEILEYVDDKNLLIEAEQKWIDELKPNYNVCPTAGSSLGWKHSEETKEKLRLLNLGEKNPMCFDKERILKNKNKKRIYKKRPKNNRIRISPEHKNKSIIRISVEGDEKEYSSITQAATELGLKRPTSIQHALHGRNKTAKGFIWKFKEI